MLVNQCYPNKLKKPIFSKKLSVIEIKFLTEKKKKTLLMISLKQRAELSTQTNPKNVKVEKGLKVNSDDVWFLS